LSVDISSLKGAIGKPVLDPYERVFGRIVGYHSDKKGKALKIGVERSDGEILSYPRSQFFVKNGSVIFIYAWKIRSEDFIKRFNVASRKIWALDKLYEKGEVSQSYYEATREQLEKSISDIIEYGKKLLKWLIYKRDKLTTQICDLERYLVSIKMQNVTGEIGENGYKSISGALRIGLEKATLEKSDIETVINIIENAPQIPAMRRINAKISETHSSNSSLTLHLEDDENLTKTFQEAIEH